MTSEDASVLTALIVAVPTMLTAVAVPIILRLLDMKERREKEDRDDRRTGEIARRVEEVARVTKQRGDTATDEIFKNRQATVDSASVTNEKLDKIHGLVDGTMSTAIQSELDATKRELAMMNELIEMRKAHGQEPTRIALDALASTSGRIVELTKQMADRNAAAVNDQSH